MKTSKNILTALLLTGSTAVPALNQTVTTKPRIQANAPRCIVIAETEAPPVIRTGLLQSTLILLPAEEKVATVFGGDTSSWVFDGGHVASRFISIKPKVANSTTDVHIVSDHGNEYTLQLREVSADADPHYDSKVFISPGDQAGKEKLVTLFHSNVAGQPHPGHHHVCSLHPQLALHSKSHAGDLRRCRWHGRKDRRSWRKAHGSLGGYTMPTPYRIYVEPAGPHFLFRLLRWGLLAGVLAWLAAIVFYRYHPTPERTQTHGNPHRPAHRRSMDAPASDAH